MTHFSLQLYLFPQKLAYIQRLVFFLMEFLHLIFQSQYQISTCEKHTAELAAVQRPLCTVIQATYHAQS